MYYIYAWRNQYLFGQENPLEYIGATREAADVTSVFESAGGVNRYVNPFVVYHRADDPAVAAAPIKVKFVTSLGKFV